MARLVRARSVRRGATAGGDVGSAFDYGPAVMRLVRTLRARRGAPRLKAKTLAEIEPIHANTPSSRYEDAVL